MLGKSKILPTYSNLAVIHQSYIYQALTIDQQTVTTLETNYDDFSWFSVSCFGFCGLVQCKWEDQL